MLATSDKFKIAMRQSHRVSIAATIHPPAGSGLPPAAVQIIGGGLRLDRDARVRRQGSIVIGFELDADLDYVRHLPFGSYVALERGVLYADGTFERPQVGYMRVDVGGWSEVEGQATLELGDRMAQVQDELFPFPWSPTGLRPSEAAVQAVHDVFGDTIAYHVTTNPATEVPLVDVVYDQDRGQAIADLASSIGAGAYFDAAGDFVLRPNPPDPETVEPVWRFEVGPDGVLEQAQENLDRSAVRNGVAVRGQPAADQPPIYSLAVDDDPTSPTRWGGPFGKVALIVSLQSVQSQAQADATAASLLNLRLGLARTVTLRGVPMPALEPDDVILAAYTDGREERLRINAIQLPLDVTGSMDLTVTGPYRPAATFTRRRRRRALRVTGGARAWEALHDARLVTS